MLVGPGPGDRATIDVVDLHTVRAGRPVPWCRASDQLARWLHSLAASIGPGGRLRSIRAYLGDGVSRRALGRTRTRVDRRIARRERIRVRSRSRRCIEESGTFTRDVGARAGWRRRDVSVETISTALDGHDRVTSGRNPSLLKAGPKSRVTRVETGVGTTVVVKERLSPTLSRRLEAACLPRRALRGYRNAHGLEVRGVATATPLA